MTILGNSHGWDSKPMKSNCGFPPPCSFKKTCRFRKQNSSDSVTSFFKNLSGDKPHFPSNKSEIGANQKHAPAAQKLANVMQGIERACRVNTATINNLNKFCAFTLHARGVAWDGPAPRPSIGAISPVGGWTAIGSSIAIHGTQQREKSS